MCKGFIGRKFLWKVKGKRTGIDRENLQKWCKFDACERKQGRSMKQEGSGLQCSSEEVQPGQGGFGGVPSWARWASINTFTVLSHRLVVTQGKNGLMGPKEQRLSVNYASCSRLSWRSEWSTCDCPTTETRLLSSVEIGRAASGQTWLISSVCHKILLSFWLSTVPYSSLYT